MEHGHAFPLGHGGDQQIRKPTALTCPPRHSVACTPRARRQSSSWWAAIRTQRPGRLAAHRTPCRSWWPTRARIRSLRMWRPGPPLSSGLAPQRPDRGAAAPRRWYRPGTWLLPPCGPHHLIVLQIRQATRGQPLQGAHGQQPGGRCQALCRGGTVAACSPGASGSGRPAAAGGAGARRVSPGRSAVAVYRG